MTAVRTVHRAPARAIARVSPKRRAPVLLALSVVGLVDALVERRADGAALAGLFDHKQPLVDLACFGDQLGEV